MKNSFEKFKSLFPDNHSMLVALHSQSIGHALEGAEIAVNNGAHGVAVVTHFIEPTEGLEAIEKIKNKYPHHKAILNILQWNPKLIFEVMQGVPNIVLPDGIRTDNARIVGIDHIKELYENYADRVLETQEEMGWNGLYFGGLDFKHQKHLEESEYPFAVQQAKKYIDVITTSGSATGVSADREKVKKIKDLAGQYPVGLASGVSAENIRDYIEHTDISLVATGISKNYYDLDPSKVLELANIIYMYNRKMERKRFEKKVLASYGVNSVEELDKYIRDHELINIGGRPESSEIEKKLSNLYPSTFILDDIEYASVEAFWMSIKYPEDAVERKTIRGLSGLEAKKSGNDARYIKSFFYLGKEIIIGSQEHHKLLKRALKAKLEQNLDILEALKNTGNRPLIHIIFTKDRKFLLPDSQTLPGEKFAKLYEELRDEFRNK